MAGRPPRACPATRSRTSAGGTRWAPTSTGRSRRGRSTTPTAARSRTATRGRRELHDELTGALGEFPLFQYWGPTAVDRALEQPKPPYVARKREHLRRLRQDATPAVLRVTAADKLHNARALLADHGALGDALFARFTAGKAGTLWYYGCAARVLGDRFPGALADELTRVVGQLRAAAAPGIGWPASEDEEPRPE